MLDDRAIYFASGSVMMKRRDSMSHPRKVMIYLRPPYASIFRIEAGSGHLVDSNAPSKVLKRMNMDLTTDWHDLDTIILLFGESSNAVPPSSMYPYAPPLRCESILTSAFSAASNMTSSSSLRGLGICFLYGEGKTSGSRSLQ